MDSMRLELQALQVENRKLREELQGQNDPSKELQLTEELISVREENVRLAKELEELTMVCAKGRDDTEELQHLRQQVEEQGELVQERQQALLGAEEEIGRLSEQLIQQQTMAELERFRAVANETSKWEARERRLAQRIEELEVWTATRQGSMLSGTLTTGSHYHSNQVSGQMVLNRHSLLASSCCTITTPNITASPKTTPYITASSITTPYITASSITTPYITASPKTTPYITASSITTPHIVGFPTTTQVGGILPAVTSVSTPLSYLNSTTRVANPVPGNTFLDAFQAETAVPFVSSPPTHVTTSIPMCISADSPILPRETLCNPADPLSLALMAQQLPPLSKFNGDDTDGEGQGFTDWIEQLELIGEVCRWNDQAKLVNLVTRLRGQAYNFYRSCTRDQRASYSTLVAALKERFTPVQIQSVQSSQFHERKQLPVEGVDSYAQDLRKLYNKAYSRTHGSREAEAMGRSVLAYQFVAGLLPHLKSKLVGSDGQFEELLTKARFEEARYRDVVVPGSRQTPIHAGGGGFRQSAGNEVPRGSLQQRQVYTNTRPSEVRKCYHCGGTNHILRDCPLKGRSAPREATGNSRSVSSALTRVVTASKDNSVPGKDVRVVTATAGGKSQETTSEEHLPDCLSNTIDQVVATLHGVEPQQVMPSVVLGPTLTSEVSLEGVPVKALLDTGSPISIVSLEVFLKACAQNRQSSETPEEWGRAVKQRFQKPTVSLRSYGGGELSIISQVKCCLSRGSLTVETILQVQKGAPVDLLLGTDVLSRLGFSFSRLENNGKLTYLLGKSESGLNVEVVKEATKDSAEPELADVSEETTPPVVVKLIRATRLPARHSKLVRVSVDCPSMLNSLCIFEPELCHLHKKGVTMSDGLVDVGKHMTLTIRNQGAEPVLLEEGDVIGYLQSAKLMEAEWDSLFCDAVVPKGTAASHESVEPRVAAIQDASRVEGLLACLGLEDVDLNHDEKEHLENLVREFCELFALSSAELGHTSLVEHPRAKTIRVALNRVRHCPTAIADKEVVVVKPVNEEDLEENMEDLGSEEEKEGEIEISDEPQVFDGQGDEEPHNIQNAWERRLRPRSPRTAAS